VSRAKASGLVYQASDSSQFDDRMRYRVGCVVGQTLIMDRPVNIKTDLDSMSEKELRELQREVTRRLHTPFFLKVWSAVKR
jgi:hypothetical protein